jgi:hypothetical protein
MTKTKTKKKKKKKQTTAERKSAKHLAKLQKDYAERRKKMTPEQRAAADAKSARASRIWEVTEKLEDDVKSGAVKLDFQGHFKGYNPGWFGREIMMMLMSARREVCGEILFNRANGKRDSRTAILKGDHNATCNSCSTEINFKVLKNKIVATSECPHPDGYPAYSVKLNVPSGKIIFGNDFRDIVRIDADYDVNGTRGTEMTTRAYADAGMIHVYVGNTCPGIYKVSESRLNIVSPSSAMSGEDDGYKELPTKPPKGVEVGGICTDLWWYSAMDYDLFKKLAKATHGKGWKDRLSKWTDIVKVKPGCYQAVGQTHLVRDVGGVSNEDGSCSNPEEMFSYIRRIGDVRKLKPQSGYAEAAEFLKTFDHAVAIRRMAWPTISRSRLSILDSFFLTLGGGLDWKDGALVSVSLRGEDAIKRYKAGERPDWTPSKKEAEWANLHREWAEMDGKEYVEPHPSFYPISEGYANCFSVPDNVRADWLGGVREILHAVIENGAGPKTDKEHKRNKSNVRLAKKALKKIDERFGKEGEGT